MLLLIAGLAIFITVHLIPTNVVLRDGLVRRLGAGPYRAIYALIALTGLGVIALGYHKLQMQPGKNPILWTSPLWMRHVVFLLMLPAIVLAVASVIASRIGTAARHPLLIATKIWALSHMLVNGDVGSLALFGSLLAWAVYDRISFKWRPATVVPAAPTGARRRCRRAGRRARPLCRPAQGWTWLADRRAAAVSRRVRFTRQ